MNFDDVLMGAILKKMAISFKENAVADFLNRHSQFENRSLVDFEIGNERKVTNSCIYDKNFPLRGLNS